MDNSKFTKDMAKEITREAFEVMRGLSSRYHDPIRDRLKRINAIKPKAGPKGDAGLGVDDLQVIDTDERRKALKFIRDGATVKEITLTVPAVIYRGLYKNHTPYTRGDMVTYGGSVWHCEKLTMAKPGTDEESWSLAVRKGRDGRHGKDGAKGERGLTGPRGKDATQLSDTGVRS